LGSDGLAMREWLGITDAACSFSLLIIISLQSNTPETILFSSQAFTFPNGIAGFCSFLLDS